MSVFKRFVLKLLECRVEINQGHCCRKPFWTVDSCIIKGLGQRRGKLLLRTIMIFPQFENINVIDNIRTKYDPLSELVRPHITIVFPFESEISNDELAQLLEKRLFGINSFEITLNGFSKQKDRFSNYLFLNVTKGMDEIKNIHNILYENEFKKFDMGYGYVPHMTVGKLSMIQLLEEAFEDVSLNCDLFNTIVDKVSVEMIGKNDESIIAINKKLA